MAGEHILIVDDEPAIQSTLKGVLEDEGYRVSAVGSGAEALARVAEDGPDLVFLDIWMSGMDGLETLEKIKRLRAEAAVVMISGHGTIETAVKATKLGAYDFIEKPLSLEKTLLTAARALEHARLARENAQLRERLDLEWDIVGQSPVMQALRQQIATAAPTTGRVLIHGENGSGKQLVARAIHQLSTRVEQPFVEVNCAAIPEELIESELFGHEKGAFTGAVARRKGKFETANSGTLFLDEIGDMSLKTQAKVLRALEEQAFERVGGKDTIKVDVRVIAASNHDLHELIARGRFREDLFYRLNVIPIEVPPLRERKAYIPALAHHFVAQFARGLEREMPELSPEFLAAVMQSDWPGNVRELQNYIERVIAMNPGRVLYPSPLPRDLEERAGTMRLARGKRLSDLVEDLEKRLLKEALRRAGGNQSLAARELGLPEPTIRYRMRKHGFGGSRTNLRTRRKLR